MPAGDPHSGAVSMTHITLGNYTISNAYGDVRTGEPGYHLERDPDTVLPPNVAWLAPGRLQRT